MSFISQKDVSSDDPKTITIYVSPVYVNNNNLIHEVPLFGRYRVILSKVMYYISDGGGNPEYDNVARVPVVLNSSVLRPKHFMTKAVPGSLFPANAIHIVSNYASGKNLKMDLGILDIYNRIDLGFFRASNSTTQANFLAGGVELSVFGETYKPWIPKSIPVFRQMYMTSGAGTQSFDMRLNGRFIARMVGCHFSPTTEIATYTIRMIQVNSDNLNISNYGTTSNLTLINFNEINGYMMAPIKCHVTCDTGLFQYTYFDLNNNTTDGSPFVLWFHLYRENDRLDFLNE